MADSINYETIREIIREELNPLWTKVNRHEERIVCGEKKDAANDAIDKTKKDSGATIVAIAALIISLIATAANILGG